MEQTSAGDASHRLHPHSRRRRISLTEQALDRGVEDELTRVRSAICLIANVQRFLLAALVIEGCCSGRFHQRSTLTVFRLSHTSGLY